MVYYYLQYKTSLLVILLASSVVLHEMTHQLLWCFPIFLKNYFQVLFNLMVILSKVKITQIIIHQIFSLARNWSKHVTWQNILRLKLGDIREYHPIFSEQIMSMDKYPWLAYFHPIWRLLFIYRDVTLLKWPNQTAGPGIIIQSESQKNQVSFVIGAALWAEKFGCCLENCWSWKIPPENLWLRST